MLVTGAVTGDPYGRVPAPLSSLGIVDAGRPVRLHECVRGIAASSGASSDGCRSGATFDRNLQESLLRSLAPPLARLGGNVWHEPLPLEHAREDEPIAALLAAAFDAAGVDTHPASAGVSARLLFAPRSILAVFVNETASDVERRIRIGSRTAVVNVPGGRSRLVLFDRTGTVLAETAGIGSP